jgi:undecaprenyl-diphosphatase
MLETIACLDAHIFQFINSHHSVFFDYVFLCLTQLGNGWVAVPLVILVIVAKTPRRRLASVLLCAVAAGALAGILNTSIKRAVDRPRPIVFFQAHAPAMRPGGENGCAGLHSEASYRVHTVGQVLRRNSFPSGHSATAFTAATILVVLYGGYFYYAYIPALLVAYSRSYLGDHFPFDTAGGALLGIIVAFVVMAVSLKFGRRSESGRNNAE